MFILEKTEHTINALEVFASDDLYEDNFAVEIISNAKKLVNDAKNTKNVGFFLFVSTLKVFFFLLYIYFCFISYFVSGVSIIFLYKNLKVVL